MKKTYSIIRDVEFSSSREKLKAARKSLKKEGKGNKSKAADPLEDGDIEKMWERGVLEHNTVWYLHMQMRRCDKTKVW